MTEVEWICLGTTLLRLEGTREQIDELLRNSERGETCFDIEERADDVDVEVHHPA